jgi:phage terminase large subunit-like protein
MGDVLRRIQRLQRRAEAFRRLAPPPESPSSDLSRLSLEAFIRAAGLQAPHHLRHLLAEAEAAIADRPQGKRFFWFSVPPRHWKTVTLRYVVAAHLLRRPTDEVIWCSHTAEFAGDQAQAIRRIVAQAGGRLDSDTQRRANWRMDAGGGLMAFGAGGIAGRGGRLIVIDDPIGSRAQAESRTERERVFRWIDDDVIPRLTPDGSVILVHTRWHPDDPIGRYAADARWSGMNIPALAEEDDDPLGRAPGEPIRPDIISRDELEQLRVKNVFKFSSLYQGRPRPRGAEVFVGNPLRFVRLPDGAHRTAYGVDLAYTAKTVADRSVCLRMQRCGEITYVTAGRISQVAAPEFTLTLRAMASEQAGPMRWYRSGTEKGSAQFIKAKVPGFRDLATTADKFVRAQGAAEGWNGGKLAFPSEDSPLYGDWVDDALDEIASFTGVKDDRDDIVDALAAGWDELNPKRAARSVSTGGGKDQHDRTVY